MALSDKIFNQSINVVTHWPQEPEIPTKLINMPCSQVAARKRPSLMHATFEYNIQSSQQDKVTYSKVRRADVLQTMSFWTWSADLNRPYSSCPCLRNNIHHKSQLELVLCRSLTPSKRTDSISNSILNRLHSVSFGSQRSQTCDSYYIL